MYEELIVFETEVQGLEVDCHISGGQVASHLVVQRLLAIFCLLVLEVCWRVIAGPVVYLRVGAMSFTVRWR